LTDGRRRASDAARFHAEKVLNLARDDVKVRRFLYGSRDHCRGCRERRLVANRHRQRNCATLKRNGFLRDGGKPGLDFLENPLRV